MSVVLGDPCGNLFMWLTSDNYYVPVVWEATAVYEVSKGTVEGVYGMYLKSNAKSSTDKRVAQAWVDSGVNKLKNAGRHLAPITSATVLVCGLKALVF